MAIETMQKIQLTAHKSVADDIFVHIQKLGCCQVIPRSHEKVGESDAASLRAQARQIDETLGEVRFVMRFLDPYAKGKSGGLAKALGDAPSFSSSELKTRASEDDMLRTAEVARSLEKRLSEARAGISRVNGALAALAPIAQLPYSLDFYTKGTAAVIGVILQAAPPVMGEVVPAIESALGRDAEIFAAPADGASANAVISVIFARSAAEKFQAAISAFQTARLEVPANLTGTPASEIKSLNGELEAFAADEAAVLKEISAMADDAYKRCEHCSDYWGIQRDRIAALLDGEQTAETIVSEFWMPLGHQYDLKHFLTPYSSLVDISAVEPDEGETPPTLLSNNKFSVPVEPLIDMFGAPAYGGFDPTWIVAPFFYAFFGICFGDAGYGLLIASLLIAFMMKKKLTGTLRKFMQILIFGNICAVIFGALTFSWFGDSISAFPFLKSLMFLDKLKILDPMGDPMTMLAVSLAFGFVQIILGLVIALRENLRKGDAFAAFADQGGWIIFLCGLVLYGLAASGMAPVSVPVSKIIAIAGMVILLATQGRSKESLIGKILSGLLSLYNVTGYLGDLLSYSRLLALGLGSAAVGMVINMLTNLVAPSMGGFGIVPAILLFVIGHVFSMVVNLLGSFVHPLRLQYVEFFGKFYDATGEAFTPLAVSTQYVELTDKEK